MKVYYNLIDNKLHVTLTLRIPGNATLSLLESHLSNDVVISIEENKGFVYIGEL